METFCEIENRNNRLTAVLVGKTQSNMSTPRAEHITRSTANPTPIRYRGLFFGSNPVHK